jgi:hypothetical protein
MKLKHYFKHIYRYIQTLKRHTFKNIRNAIAMTKCNWKQQTNLLPKVTFET